VSGHGSNLILKFDFEFKFEFQLRLEFPVSKPIPGSRNLSQANEVIPIDHRLWFGFESPI
jgi:hypothetical protein